MIRRVLNLNSCRLRSCNALLSGLSKRQRSSVVSNENNRGGRRGSRATVAISIAAVSLLLGASYSARNYRKRRLSELNYVNAETSNALKNRKIKDLIRLVKRTGLMGISGAISVKDELDIIRVWHNENGYKGGLVLRDLTEPLFSTQNDNNEHHETGIIDDMENLILDPMQLARRECYYLYYEITGAGEIRQQIFCRGTTLAIDILTCLQLWMVYDEELECRIHLGFRNQAERILEDVLPLLSPESDKRATIEVSGHSLGGAVACILAAKLRKRGYNVVRATSIAGPPFCSSSNSASVVRSLLPKDSLRIVNDTDPVPFLPPFCHHVGNKLWLFENSNSAYYIPDDGSKSWVDSLLINFLVPEILQSKGRSHRVPYYISRLERLQSRRQ